MGEDSPQAEIQPEVPSRSLSEPTASVKDYACAAGSFSPGVR